MSIEKRICEELRAIEARDSVTILYACESGSRAWGFPSEDSDYDVRFLYVHPQEWYLRVDNDRLRDVIELPIDDELDISGWELRKALNLLYKSNPALIEWINSPIIYRRDETFHQEVKTLLPIYYSPKACFHHYAHMASGNNRGYLQGEEVNIKKYFYVLRPVLAMRWIERELGVVPTEFAALMDATLTDPELTRAIQELLAMKAKGFESKFMPRVPVISDFIESELERFTRLGESINATKTDFGPMNEFFLQIIQ
ncbi:MAG: nucleotidyltransferase domain-containing protein [Planctomycetota bacterium]